MMRSARTLARRFAFLVALARPTRAFVGTSHLSPQRLTSADRLFRPAFLSTTGNDSKAPDITHIGKEQMEEILEDYEEGGREGSLYCVIDVRGEDEIMATGKLSPSVITLPIQVIAQTNAFQLDPEDFEVIFGFEKPNPDETLVFTCAAGVRSIYACNFAAAAGYSKLVNYVGGSHEWFGSR